VIFKTETEYILYQQQAEDKENVDNVQTISIAYISPFTICRIECKSLTKIRIKRTLCVG